MADQQTALDFLEQKIEILEHIEVNSKWQERFLREANIKGLRRLMSQRAAWLGQLEEVNKNLADAIQRENLTVSALPQFEALRLKQKAVLESSAQAIQAAELERNRLFAELGLIRKQKHLRDQYLNPYSAVVPGRRINRKG